MSIRNKIYQTLSKNNLKYKNHLNFKNNFKFLKFQGKCNKILEFLYHQLNEKLILYNKKILDLIIKIIEANLNIILYSNEIICHNIKQKLIFL